MITASRVDGTGEGVVDTSLFLLTSSSGKWLRRSSLVEARTGRYPVRTRGGAQDSQYLILSVS
jgi:hypothetical protein